MDDSPLPYWHAVHITAIVAQCCSMLCSGTVITSFFILKDKRTTYNYLLLYANMSDFFWVAWHFSNHVQALADGHVTTNPTMCTAFGMLTFIGVGWEISWFMVMASYCALLIYKSNELVGGLWEPSRRTKVLAHIFCWCFPVLFYGSGALADIYVDAGYFCWINTGSWTIWLYGEGIVLLSIAYIAACYGYIIVILVKQGRISERLTGKTYNREIKRFFIYILVNVIWLHPYVLYTSWVIAGHPINYPILIYFVGMVNGLGVINLIVYSWAEKWCIGKTKRKVTLKSTVVAPVKFLSNSLLGQDVYSNKDVYANRSRSDTTSSV